MRNSEIASKLYEAWNARDWSAFGALLSPEVAWRSPATGERAEGREAVLSMVQRAAEALSGMRIEVRSLFESGDAVVVECAFRGASAPAGRTATFFEVARFERGLCVRGALLAGPPAGLPPLASPRAA